MYCGDLPCHLQYAGTVFVFYVIEVIGSWKVMNKYGESVDCDDVIGDYSGSESLSDDEKKAMIWAISKGILNETEESSKTIDTGRPMTSAEVAAFCK